MKSKSRIKQYFRVPVTVDEIFRIRFLDESTADNYFKELLSSPRPEHTAPAIVFEKDNSHPGELFGIVYGEDATLKHFLYFSTDKVLLPLLAKRFKTDTSKPVVLPIFQEFKADNSRLKAIFSDKLTLPMDLGDARVAPQPPPQAHALEKPPDPILIAVLLVLLSLLSHFVSHRRAKKKLLLNKNDAEEVVMNLIAGITDPRKRSKVERMVGAFPELMGDRGFVEKVVSFVNEAAHDDRVAGEVERFLETIPNPKTRRVLKRILNETTARVAGTTTTTSRSSSTPVIVPLPLPPTTKPPQRRKSLRQFLRQNRQHITTPAGAVSPAFVGQLRSFLSGSGAAPTVQASLTALAKQLIRKDPTMTHRKMTDALIHATTEPMPRRHFTISPARKTTRRRSRSVPQQKEQKQEQEQEHEPGRAEAVQLVRRTPGHRQSQLGAAVVDTNIQRILHESNTYTKMLSTLRDVIQSRRIQDVYVVDAPNVLAHPNYTYARRQRESASEGFIRALRNKLGASMNDMVVVVSQMNRDEWRKDDPVYFGRIGDDEANAFLVRVGCYDNDKRKDCHLSENTNHHNECDDFVRLDLMARLLHDDKPTTKPQFIHVTNDKGRNWQFVSDRTRKSKNIRVKHLRIKE